MTRCTLPFTSVARCHFDGRSKGSGLPPKWLLSELCDEVGLPRVVVERRMARSSIEPPKPSMRSAKGIWYDPVAWRAWFKADKEALDAKA